MKNQKLYTLIESLPEDKKKEVETFVQFLLTQLTKQKIPLSQLRGKWKGLIEMSPDFDGPLEDFKEYME